MTITEIITLAEQAYGARYQVSQATLIQYLDIVQKTAFSKDLLAFQYWGAYMTINAGVGPYSFPTTVPVRKMIGVTAVTDADIFGSTVRYLADNDDYGMDLRLSNERRFYEPGRIDPFARTFTFINTPSTASNYYRWVYYRRPGDIAALNSTTLIIPEEYHHSVCLQGVIAIADNALNGDKPMTPEIILMPYLQGFWEDMRNSGNALGQDTWFNEGVS